MGGRSDRTRPPGTVRRATLGTPRLDTSTALGAKLTPKLAEFYAILDQTMRVVPRDAFMKFLRPMLEDPALTEDEAEFRWGVLRGWVTRHEQRMDGTILDRLTETEKEIAARWLTVARESSDYVEMRNALTKARVTLPAVQRLLAACGVFRLIAVRDLSTLIKPDSVSKKDPKVMTVKRAVRVVTDGEWLSPDVRRIVASQVSAAIVQREDRSVRDRDIETLGAVERSLSKPGRTDSTTKVCVALPNLLRSKNRVLTTYEAESLTGELLQRLGMLRPRTRKRAGLRGLVHQRRRRAD